MIPRARRNGETVVTKRADELTADDYGRIVQHPGNRGWLRCAEPDGRGTYVNTTTGCATYPRDAVFLIWGHDDPPRCLRHSGALLRNCRTCKADRKAEGSGMTEPRYEDGWLSEEEFRRLDLPSDVTYRSIMRRCDGQVWTAPLGTPDPWSADDRDNWVALDATTP